MARQSGQRWRGIGRYACAFALAACVALATDVAARASTPADDAAFSGESHADSAHEWRAVYYGDTKVGHASTRRQHVPDRIVTEDELTLRVQQGNVVEDMRVLLRYEETPDGEPLAFASEVGGGAALTTTTARIEDGVAHVATTVSGATRRSRVPVPTDALFPEAERRLLQAMVRDGTPLARYTTFDAVDVTPLAVELSRQDDAPARSDIAVLQRRNRGKDGDEFSTLAVDAAGIMRTIDLRIAGLPLHQRACDRDCALAPDAPLDMLERLTLRAPYHLPPHALRRTLRFELSGDDGALVLPATGEQRVAHDGERTIVFVCTDCGDETTPDDATLARARSADLWLQSDDAELRAMARRAAGRGDDARRMTQLVTFVSAHMGGRNDVPGYATALHAARTRRGDCSEYAMLLAALARAHGIPVRLAAGIAYVEQQRGRRAVFTPHMWTQAFVDGRWRSYDAALEGFGSGHIVFALSYGDPAELDAGMRRTGDARVIAAGLVLRREDRAAATTP